MQDKLARYVEIQRQIRALEAEKESLNTGLKLDMKIAGISRFEDTQGTIVTITTQQRESLDKEKVRALLGEEPYKQVLKTTSFEVVKVLSVESLKRMREYRQPAHQKRVGEKRKEVDEAASEELGFTG